MKKFLYCFLVFLIIGSAAGGAVLFSNLSYSDNRGRDFNTPQNSITATAPDNTDLWTASGNYASAFDNEGEAGIDGTTEETAYEIRTAEQLALLAYRINTSSTSSTYCSLYYKQTANIDLSAHYWDAIGISSSYNFSGYYDGGGYEISGLYTQAGTTSTYNYQGLFGYIYNRGTDYVSVHDVIIKDSEIQGYEYVGAIAGYVGRHSNQYGVYIYNCTSYASVSGAESVGGIIGQLIDSSATIENCHNFGEVTATNTYGYVGGIIGYCGAGNNTLLSLSNSSNHALIQGVNYVGGIAGSLSSTTGEIFNCYNVGEIISQESYAGGIVGREYSSYGKNNIYNCYNEGKITSSSGYAGGIAGYACDVYYSYNIGTIICGGNYSGGIAGIGTDIFSCYNRGDINGVDYVGGVSGSATINCCYNTGTVNGESYVGGVSGSGTVYNCFNLGEINGVDSSTTGAIGNSAEVYNSYWEENLLIGNAVGTNFSAANCGRCSMSDVINIDWYNGAKWHSSYAWDFMFAWDIRTGENDNLPVLKAFYEKTRTNVYWTDYGNYADSFDGGNGTEASPYLIRTPEQLALLAYLINNGSTNSQYRYSYFRQTADIDLSGCIWVPIGMYNSISYNAFSGYYDGDGNKITGLNFIGEINCAGLFGYTRSTDSAVPTIFDLTIENSDNDVSSGHAGYLVGYAYGSINLYNCYNYGNINSDNDYAYLGGLIGYASDSCSIEDCANFGTIYATTYAIAGTHGVGGIIGYVEEYANITNCYNAGTVTNSSSSSRAWRAFAGGVVGVVYGSGVISGCFNSGDVVGIFSGVNNNFSGVGGVIGISYNDTSISNCYNKGNVSSQTAVGGVVGNGDATNCYNTGSVSGSGGSVYAGGVVGNGEASYCYNEGNVSSASSAYAGGIVGSGNATYCFNTASLSAQSHLGGVVGSGSAQYCYNIGDVSSSGGNIYLGGLCASGSANNCYNVGNIVGSSSYSGGITGRGGAVYNCYNLGDVTGWYVGGIAGQCFSSSVYNCINMGNLSITTGYEGGIVGGLYGSATYKSGGYYWSTSPAYIRYCYWDENVDFSHATSSDLNRKAYGEASTSVYTDAGNEIYAPSAWDSENNGTCTTEESKDTAWYLDSSNWHSSYPWDFTNVWTIVDGINNGYPILQNSFINIAYQANDGSNRVVTEQVSGWQNYTIADNDIFERTGHELTHWNTSPTGTGVNYYAGDVYAGGANLTLYAQWEPAVYRIELNANDGSGGLSAMYVKYNTGFYSNSAATAGLSSLSDSNLPTRAGYTLLGFYTANSTSSTCLISVTTNSSGVRTGTFTDAFTTTYFTGPATLYAQWEANNPAYYDEAGDYWYIENGRMPQTRVTDAATISALNANWSTLENGSTYYMGANEGEFVSKVYNSNEYCECNGEYYLVKPIRWRLISNSNQEIGYGTSEDTYAVMADMVYVGRYVLNAVDGSSTPATYNIKHHIDSTYLVTETKSMPTFGTGANLYGDPQNVTDYIFVSSREEIMEVVGTYKIEFSDFVNDYITNVRGSIPLYYTRDLGTNYNHAICLTEDGEVVQRQPDQIYNQLGVQFTIKVSEYACVG